MSNITSDITLAISALQRGDIIAYPTEAVYGLGCDPLNQAAVMRLLALKKRAVAKGLILIAADWSQLSPYVAPIPDKLLADVFATWPGPVTWIFPAATFAPKWICGEHTTLAVRVTAHPLASELCRFFGAPLVSTSANEAGLEPARCADEVSRMFATGIEVIVQGEVGGLLKPTTIRDALTGKIIRQN